MKWKKQKKNFLWIDLQVTWVPILEIIWACFAFSRLYAFVQNYHIWSVTTQIPKVLPRFTQITFPAQGGAAWHFQVPGLVSAPSLTPTKGSGNLCLPYLWNTSRIDHFLPPSHHHLHPKIVCPSSLLPTTSSYCPEDTENLLTHRYHPRGEQGGGAETPKD